MTLSAAQRQQMRELIRERVKDEAIAAEVGCAESTVRRRRQRLGIVADRHLNGPIAKAQLSVMLAMSTRTACDIIDGEGR